MRPKYSYTTNEAKQFENSGDALVDFFRSAASQRQAILSKQDNLFKLFINAYNQDKEVASKLIFWLRDPRRGAGEKAASRKLFQLLFEASPDFIFDNLDSIVKYGYWKDLILFIDEDKTGTIAKYWADKINNNDRLAAKWAPRLHSKYHKAAIKIKTAMGINNSEYRKILKTKSETVEQVMTQGLWDSIIYDRVPSNAMKIYNRAFRNHDAHRFEDWINSNKTKANAGAVYPHEILMLSINQNEHELAQKMWNNLPNFIKKNEKFMVILDTSASMEDYNIIGKKISPAIIGVALTLYLSERNNSEFRNTFISFSENPHIINIPETGTLKSKFEKIMRTEWSANTNFQAAYKLILQKAVYNKLRQSDMPTMLLILSDMQFDRCTSGNTHLEEIQNEYKKWGYKVPKLIFWNLNEVYTGSAATSKDKNVGLVSGFSPSLMEAVLACKSFLPIDLVMETVKKYDDIECKSLPTIVDLNDAIIRCNNRELKLTL